MKPRLLIYMLFYSCNRGEGGGGSAGHLWYFKIRYLHEREICRVLETPLNVLEMLKLFR